MKVISKIPYKDILHINQKKNKVFQLQSLKEELIKFLTFNKKNEASFSYASHGASYYYYS